MKAIIAWSLNNRFLVLLAALALTAWGLVSLTLCAMAAAGLAVTLVPVLMGYLVRGRIPHIRSTRD
jgi:Cu/Ag efflux pump CusA